MIGMPRIDMNEVTRLTRQGRLREALDLLQGRGGGDGPAPTRPSGGGEPAPRPAEILDLIPPVEPGGAWTDAPATGERRREPRRRSGPLRGLGDVIRDRLRRLDPNAPKVDVPVPPGARFEGRSFAGTEGTRAYKLYVPASYQPHGALVVMLHGCTQNPDDFALGTGMNALAERDGFLVAYPAQTRAANPSTCWNWFRPEDQRRGAGEPAIVAGITRAVVAELAADPARVYVAGLSAGGAAAVVLGATYPDLYAAVGVHSGLAYRSASDVASALAAMKGGAGRLEAGADVVPTIVFHGDADRTVNPLNGEQIVEGLRTRMRAAEAGMRETSDEHETYARVALSRPDGTPTLEHWTVRGAGHAWSGGNPAGSYTDARGPDASAEMIRFFAHHRLAGGTPR